MKDKLGLYEQNSDDKALIQWLLRSL